MVILGGLEIVAAGYLIHKHQQNKRDKQRLANEAADLEESNYRIFPPNRPASSSGHRRRRSHSRESSGRHSHERRERRDRHDRPHSEDGKYRRDSSPPRRDSGSRPSKSQLNIPPPHQQSSTPVYHAQVPVPIITQSFPPPPPQAQAAMHPPPPPAYNTVPTANYAPPQDMKYGWTDEPARAPQQQQTQQDPDSPPTGWPAHWSQSQTPPTLAPPRAETSSGRRHERRARTPEPHSSRVRFDVPRSGSSVRSSSRSPPPSYRG